MGSREDQCRRGAAPDGAVALPEASLMALSTCCPLGAGRKVPGLKPFPSLRPCEDVAKTVGKLEYFPAERGGGAAGLRHISV